MHCHYRVIYWPLLQNSLFPLLAVFNKLVNTRIETTYVKQFPSCMPFLSALFSIKQYLSARSRLAPNKWEMSLESNTVSQLLGVSLESTLCLHRYASWIIINNIAGIRYASVDNVCMHPPHPLIRYIPWNTGQNGTLCSWAPDAWKQCFTLAMMYSGNRYGISLTIQSFCN